MNHFSFFYTKSMTHFFVFNERSVNKGKKKIQRKKLQFSKLLYCAHQFNNSLAITNDKKRNVNEKCKYVEANFYNTNNQNILTYYKSFCIFIFR